ncbi:hypothetical protein VaNZ11_003822 [Volvox africanus]|uniref:Tubulin--tyrosine ligase-like protein 5 n=1 Tax=Volvox africanus TaxID=51714 RepID=A0ABQ5RVY1_9CHLO|nr:hypothetical protein VaNZ11_003822 [Volvox africanus]
MRSKRHKIEHDGIIVGAGAAMPRHPLSAVGGPIPTEGQEVPTASTSASTTKGTFRFWHEERRFKGIGERCIVQRALFEHGGVRTGGYPKTAPIPGPLGWQRPGDWDFLWAPARLALRAIPHLKPGQLVSACPGLMSITKKRRLPATLKEALGDMLAWDIVPHSFSLPEELPQLTAHAASVSSYSPEAGRVSSGTANGTKGESEVAAAPAATGATSSRTQELWILKTAQHLGKGLKLVPLEAAAVEAGRPRRRPTQKPYVLAQRYVDRPLLVDGRKFGIRVWVAVTGFNPLRAYLHSNGLVLFSTHGYDNSSWRTEAGDVALGHITNYAQNMDGTVWNLQQLEGHMGTETYGKMWRQVQRNSALVIAAALKHIKADHEALKCPSGMTCEVVGLDYLIDEDLHPWLLEVNGTPSLQVEHEDARVEQLIHDQKYGMVQDLMSLLGIRERFKPRYAALRAAAKAKQQAVSAAAAAVASNGGSHAAAAAVAAAAAAKPSAALTRRLREQMQPTSDTAVIARVAEEIMNRGGFEPLMPLMPLDPQPGLSIPWDPRDYELRRAMAASREWQHSGTVAGATAAAAAGAGIANGCCVQQQQQQQQEEDDGEMDVGNGMAARRCVAGSPVESDGESDTEDGDDDDVDDSEDD